MSPETGRSGFCKVGGTPVQGARFSFLNLTYRLIDPYFYSPLLDPASVFT